MRVRWHLEAGALSPFLLFCDYPDERPIYESHAPPPGTALLPRSVLLATALDNANHTAPANATSGGRSRCAAMR
jgi:hypothetical protein